MSISKKEVLLVDDDKDHCEMLASLLADDHFAVKTVGSAAEARERTGMERVDLYIIDAYLPGESGFELCLRIREIDSQTPIIFYSGSDTRADKERGLAAGAQSYLIKPDDLENLKATILRLLDQTKTWRAGG